MANNLIEHCLLNLLEAPTLDDAIISILEIIMQNFGWDVGELWKLDRAIQRLRCVNSYQLPDTQAEEFIGIGEKMLLAIGTGFPGQAWKTGIPLWFEKITNDPNFLRHDMAVRVGLCSAFSLPLKQGSETVAVIQLFSKQHQPLNEELVKMMTTIGNQIGRAMARSEAMEVLKASEQQYRSLVNSIPDITWRLSSRGKPIFVSPNVKKIIGFTEEEFLQDSNCIRFRSIHHDDVGVVQTAFKSLLNKNLPIDIEYRFQRKDGKWIWLRDRANVTYEQDGTKYVNGFSTDITIEKNSQDILKEQALLAAFSSDIGLALTRNDTLHNILSLCANALVKHLNATFACIWILNADNDALELQASAEISPDTNETDNYVSVGTRKIGMIAQERKPHLTNSIIDDPNVNMEWVEKTATVAFAGYPMIVDDELVGIMAMFANRPLSETTLEAMRLTATEIALGIKKKMAQTALEEKSQQLTAITRAMTIFLDTGNWHESCTILLRSALVQTASEYGFVGVVVKGQVLRVIAHEGIVWDKTENHKFYEEAIRTYNEKGYLEFTNFNNLLGPVIINGQTLISNDPMHDSRSGGRPAGHPPLRNFLGVPISKENEIVGMIGVANRPGGYMGAEQAKIEAISRAIGILYDSYRRREYEIALEEKRRIAEEELRAERALLTKRVAEHTMELSVANAQLARAGRLKDEFLASMSHELRTPLNAILGLTEALLEQTYGPLNERQKRSLTTVEESGRHLLMLINDILDLSKIEAGKLELQIGAVAIESVCQASLRIMKESANKKQIKVDWSFDKIAQTIQADARRLKQILVNLLSNAIKFTNNGGAIGLEVTSDPVQATVHFSVWDTGVGIAPKDMEHLFQPFVQLDSSLARHHNGTGLGLTLVSRMVKLHDGGITVESELGQGSRFTISLPWQKDIVTKPSITDELTTIDKLTCINRVLVIEDISAHAEQLERYLTEWKVNVVIYHQGQGALNKALEIQPDVIILDIMLHDLSGLDILAQFRSEPRLENVPVLIISVLDERAQGLAQGANEYLVKPISREQLGKALRKLAKLRDNSSEETTTPVAHNEAEKLILLAEDCETNIETVCNYLLAHGYRLQIARNGREVIEQAKENRPDLILMDVQMPGMDGLEATRRIRQDDQLTKIPIIAVTALVMPGDRERCLAAGANDYISKPIQLKDLLKRIKAQLALLN
ncbi:MAG: response regulator [Acidobacteriota bacterium]